MPLRKISVAVDCDNDQQRDMVQNIATDMSNRMTIKANNIIDIYPLLVNNHKALSELFNLITKDGPKSLLTPKGIATITKLTLKK